MNGRPPDWLPADWKEQPQPDGTVLIQCGAHGLLTKPEAMALRDMLVSSSQDRRRRQK